MKLIHMICFDVDSSASALLKSPSFSKLLQLSSCLRLIVLTFYIASDMSFKIFNIQFNYNSFSFITFFECSLCSAFVCLFLLFETFKVFCLYLVVNVLQKSLFICICEILWWFIFSNFEIDLATLNNFCRYIFVTTVCLYIDIQ